MSATYARVTPSLPCGNPNASRTDERPVQLTRTDGHETRTDGHVDNPDKDNAKMYSNLSICKIVTKDVELPIPSLLKT